MTLYGAGLVFKYKDRFLTLEDDRLREVKYLNFIVENSPDTNTIITSLHAMKFDQHALGLKSTIVIYVTKEENIRRQ